MTPEKDEDSLGKACHLTLFPYQQRTTAAFMPPAIVDLPVFSSVFNYYQSAEQDQFQSRNLSFHSNTTETPKHRPRKTFTKDLIRLLNEAFKFYEQQPSNSRYSLTDIAMTFQIGYSTILRKYREFKSHSVVQEGKRLTAYPKSYQKSRLARIVVSRSLAERDSFGSAQEISKYVMQRYGLYYDPQIIRKQLRAIGVKRNQKHQILGINQSQSCDHCLLQRLIQIKSKIVYFSQSNVTFQNEERATIALLSSNFGVKLAVFSKEMEQECISSLKKDFQSHFLFEINDKWYLIIDETTPYWNSQYQSKKAVIHHDQQLSNSKILKICSYSHFVTPGHHLLNEIVSKIETSGFTLSQAISTLPRWLEIQQDTSKRFIKQAEFHLTNEGHSFPV